MKNTHFLKIIEEISTDLNPWEIFLPFSKKLNNVLLESSLIDKKLGKYSIIGIDPFLIFKSKNNKNKITYPFINKTSVIYGNTFDVLGQLIKKYSFIKDKSFPIYGGAIGYFAYEQFHNVESKLKIKTIDDLKLPDSYFCFYDIVILFDHFKNKKYIIAIDYLNNKTKLQKRIRDIKDIIKKTSKLKRIDIKNTKFMHKPISSASQKEYEDMVKKIRDYIKGNKNNYIGALRLIPLKTLKLFIHSYQSFLFNKIANEYLSYNINPRNLKIPIIGFDFELSKIKDIQLKNIFKKTTDEEKINPRDFIISQIPELTSEGNFRDLFFALNFKILEIAKDELNKNNQKIKINFALPKSCYATIALEFLFQQPQQLS